MNNLQLIIGLSVTAVVYLFALNITWLSINVWLFIKERKRTHRYARRGRIYSRRPIPGERKYERPQYIARETPGYIWDSTFIPAKDGSTVFTFFSHAIGMIDPESRRTKSSSDTNMHLAGCLGYGRMMELRDIRIYIWPNDDDTTASLKSADIYQLTKGVRGLLWINNRCVFEHNLELTTPELSFFISDKDTFRYQLVFDEQQTLPSGKDARIVVECRGTMYVRGETA